MNNNIIPRKDSPQGFRMVRAQGVGSEYIPCSPEVIHLPQKKRPIKIITPFFVIITVLCVIAMIAL